MMDSLEGPSYHEIRVPKETVNDSEYIVLEVTKPTGTEVHPGDVLVILETSKAVVEIRSPVGGFFHHGVSPQTHVAVGAVIGIISSDPAGPGPMGLESDRPVPSNESEIHFSKAALDLMEVYGLTPELFSGVAFVRREDVESYVVASGDRGASASKDDSTVGSKIVVIGGGGHAKMCIDIIHQNRTFEIAGILDSVLTPGTSVLGVPVLGKVEELGRFVDAGVRLAVNGVGGAEQHLIRADIYRKILAAGCITPNLFHPKSTLEPSCKIGGGNQFMAGSVIGSEAVISDNCVVNSNAVVSHDCWLGSNVHVAPGAVLAGGVEVGANTLIGMGSTVFLRVKIGEHVTIANGAHVDKDVPSGAVVRR